MPRRGWLIALAAVLLVGCLRHTSPGAPLPTPPPTLLPAATLPPPTPADLVAPGEGVTYTSPRHGYTVALPSGWRALVLPVQANDLLQAAGQPLELVAGLDAADAAAAPQAQLTVLALPRGGLTLGAYLDQTAAQIAAESGAAVDRAELDPTLRGDGLPAAVVEYTVTSDSGDPQAGYQATLVGGDPDTLIVLTFTARAAVYAELRPQFIEIVRRVELTPPAATP